MPIRKWEKDKWKHFYVGIPLGILLQFFAMHLLGDYTYASAAAFIVLVIICYGFELVSLVTGKGHYEVMDAVAGIAGGLLGMGSIWLFA